MTNGEKIQKDFKGCEVCEPIVEDDIIHVIFADKKDSAIGFDWSWWNAEYKEPTTKNCESCRYYGSHHEACNYCYKCSLWTKKESTTKNDLGVDCIDRQATLDAILKRLGIKNETYLLEAERVIYQQILAMPSVTPQLSSELEKNSKKLEKDFGESDCISRQAVLDLIADYNLSMGQVVRGIHALPPVTPQPRKGKWLRMSDLSEQEDDRYKCSRCGNVIHHKNKMDLYTFNSWCGRCGSDNGRHMNYEVEE